MTEYAFVDRLGYVISTINLTNQDEIDLASPKYVKMGVRDLVLASADGFSIPRWNFNKEEWYDASVVTPSVLERHKKTRNEEIDEKTGELISQGMSFNGESFSLSHHAQVNWQGLKIAITGGLLTEADFPFPISTLNGSTYNLQWADMDSFFGLVLQTINTYLIGGRTLKDQVNAATTIEEVDAVVDNR